MRKKTYYGEEEPKKRLPDFKKMTGLDGWDIFKGAAGLLAGGCASAVSHRYLVAAVPKGSNAVEKVVIAAGVYFVTGFVGHKVEQYVLGELDDLKKSVMLAERISSEKKEGGEDVDNG